MTPDERFWAKVDKTPDGCWLWTAYRCPNGYGKFRHPAVKSRLAHRVAYELLRGPILDGLELDHLCRVRHCVNPAHLEPVTRRENVRRGISQVAAQMRQVTCIREHGVEFDYVSSQGRRRCRKCDALRQARYANRKNDEAVARVRRLLGNNRVTSFKRVGAEVKAS